MSNQALRLLAKLNVKGEIMNCECAPAVFEIFTGQDKTMNLRAAYPATGLPLDLTTCDEISVALPNADGTFTDLLLSANQIAITSPANLGMISVTIPAAISALLNVGVGQTIFANFTISGLVTIVRFLQAFTVIEAP